MKKVHGLIFCCLIVCNAYSQQRVNELLDSLKITPTTISFHPEGDILISTDLNRKDNSQYLLVITHRSDKIHIDTLQCDRPNRSAFSKNGDYLIHNFRDPISKKFYTVKRKYNGTEDIGDPFYLSERLFVDNMYYYFMDENQDFYYYTYVREKRSDGGLLYTKFENGKYQKPQMIHPDRENAVAYSPLLLNTETMIFAQHGIKDDKKEGIYFSIREEGGKWSNPIPMDGIPMSNVITYYNKDTIAFLLDKNARLKFYDKAALLGMIENKQEDKASNSVYDSQPRNTSTVEVFQPGIISLEGIKEGSPSITSDGNTIVFVRYQNYGEKVPFIANKTASGWEVDRLTFVDTLYNLAISPDGQRIVFKTRNRPSPEADRVNNAFRVDRKEDGSWAEPVQMQANLKDAGYFRIAEDGTLYSFINASEGTPRGIFTSEIKDDGSYTDPMWLSDAVSPFPSVTYSPVINAAEDKIIVNRAGLNAAEEKLLGKKGLYIHRKYGFQWDTGTRLNLPYSWYSMVTPDEKIVFVDEGDLYVAELNELGVKWNSE